MEAHGVLWSPTELFGVLLSNHKVALEPYGALWSPMESYGALWGSMEPYGAKEKFLWSPMEPYGALWNAIARRKAGRQTARSNKQTGRNELFRVLL